MGEWADRQLLRKRSQRRGRVAHRSHWHLTVHNRVSGDLVAGSAQMPESPTIFFFFLEGHLNNNAQMEECDGQCEMMVLTCVNTFEP